MEVRINRKALIDAFLVGASLAGRNKVIPILECAKLSFSGNFVMVSSMDGESAIVKRLQISDTAEGTYCVHAMDFMKALRSVKEDDVVLAFEDNKVSIVYSRGSFELPLWGVDAFPTLPKRDSTAKAMIPADVLSRWVAIAKNFVGDDELRPVLSGMYLYIEDNELGVCATNAHKLFADSMEYDNAEGVKTNVIIPFRVFGALSSVIEDATSVLMTVDEKNVTFAAGDAKISCRLIEGNYANFKQIIPKSSDNLAAIGRQELIDAVTRVSLCANALTALINLSFKSDSLTVRGEDMDFAKIAEEGFTVRHDGADINLAVKADYLLTLLSTATSFSILLEMSEERKPIVIRDMDHPSTVLLMMPMVTH